MNKNDIKLMSESYKKVLKEEGPRISLPPNPPGEQIGPGSTPEGLRPGLLKDGIEDFRNITGKLLDIFQRAHKTYSRNSELPELADINERLWALYERLEPDFGPANDESYKVSKPKRTYRADELYRNTEGKWVPYPSANQ